MVVAGSLQKRSHAIASRRRWPVCMSRSPARPRSITAPRRCMDRASVLGGGRPGAASVSPWCWTPLAIDAWSVSDGVRLLSRSRLGGWSPGRRPSTWSWRSRGLARCRSPRRWKPPRIRARPAKGPSRSRQVPSAMCGGDAGRYCFSMTSTHPAVAARGRGREEAVPLGPRRASSRTLPRPTWKPFECVGDNLIPGPAPVLPSAAERELVIATSGRPSGLVTLSPPSTSRS
jgi:hypothetical protein